MSLLPPPCELFTIRDPFFIATLDSPPGVTLISFLPYIAKGLKSTHLGDKLFSNMHGVVDNLKIGCAINLEGAFLTFEIYFSISYSEPVSPIIIP